MPSSSQMQADAALAFARRDFGEVIVFSCADNRLCDADFDQSETNSYEKASKEVT